MNSDYKTNIGNGKMTSDDLICPVCKTVGLIIKANELLCSNEICFHFSQPYFSVNNKPILIDFENSLVSKSNFSSNVGASVVVRTESGIKKGLRNVLSGQNPVTKKNVDELINMISATKSPRILVVGGGEIGAGLDIFYEKFANQIIAFDIYDSNNVDLIADGHSIPFKSEIFDLVIIQAVLEHVLIPEKVVSEINRVMRPGGVIYAETPFMQQVHEGPYDFIRYTESGHRYLFRHFKMIRSGFTSGAGSALLWSLDFFFSGLLRTRLAGKLIRIVFFWLRFFDRIIPSNFNIDAACGVFFMGSKNDIIFDNKSIITHYKGSQIS